MNIKSCPLLLVLTLLAVSIGRCQSVTSGLVDSFQVKWAPHSGSLIYLQTSKGIYESGEDLWFKAYALDNQHAVPYTGDTTLYVELLRQSDHRAVWQQKYLLQNGMAAGQVYLSDTLLEGDYLLAAFSRHSFYPDSLDFDALRKVIIRKSIIQKVELGWTFDKPVFKSGDTVKMSVGLHNLSGAPIRGGRLRVSLWREDTCYAESWKEIKNDSIFLSFGPNDVRPGTVVKLLAIVTQTMDQAFVDATIPFRTGKVYFHVFPEGGYLLYGVPGLIAFSASDETGSPVEVSGTLFEDDRPLSDFHSRHNGMGSLSFVPKSGSRYSIRLRPPLPDSSYHIGDILPAGMSLHLVSNDSMAVEFMLYRTPSDVSAAPFYLRAQVRGMVCSLASGKITGDSTTVRVPARYFPQGIAEVTLFDGRLRPMAERLVYVNADRKLYIDAKLSPGPYPPHSKVNIRLRTRDLAGRPVRAILAMSVFDRLYRNGKDAKDIVTHYYLSSQLKGRLYDPDYYFRKGSEGAMDLLMLTQGWRRYVWGDATPVVVPILTDGTPVEVRLQHPKKQKGDYMTMLFSPGNENYRQMFFTGINGRFVLTPQDLTAGPYIYAKPMVSEDVQAQVKVYEPFGTIDRILAGKKLVYPATSFVVRDTVVPDGLGSFRAKMLKDIIIKSRLPAGYRDKYLGTLDSIAGYNAVTDYIDVPFEDTVSYRVNDKRYFLNNPYLPLGWRRKPIEGKTYEVAQWNNVDFDQAAPPAVGSDAHLINGVKYVVYHYPHFTEEELLKTNHLGRAKGYYTHKEFYRPDYTNLNSTDSLTDSRNTLDWEPEIITDQNGEVNLSIFCSDVPSFYIGKVEGVGNGELLGTTEFEFRLTGNN